MSSVRDGDLLVLARDGRLFRVRDSVVMINNGEPVKMKHREWKLAVSSHLRFGAPCVLESHKVTPSNLVVLQFTENDRTHTNWFLKISFQLPLSVNTAGENLLWQLPHAACMKMIIGIKEHSRLSPESEFGELLSTFYPTTNRNGSSYFRPELYEGVYTDAVTDVCRWNDHIAMMSVHPARTLGYKTNDQYYEKAYNRVSLARPRIKQSVFPLETLPDDLKDTIMNSMLDGLVDAPDVRDLNTLLALRSVNKAFRIAVDEKCCSWAQKAYDNMCKAIDSKKVRALQDIGRNFLSAGICVSDPYTSWTARQWASKQNIPENPISFLTYISWRRGRNTELPAKNARPRHNRLTAAVE